LTGFRESGTQFFQKLRYVIHLPFILASNPVGADVDVLIRNARVVDGTG